MPQPRDTRFVKHLEDLAAREDRGALAALRRGLTMEPADMIPMYPHVTLFLAPDAPRSREKAYYLVAALFALHPDPWHRAEGSEQPTNLGASVRRLRERSPEGSEDAGENRTSSLDRRFIALLNAHPEDLAQHLRHIVGLLQSGDSPVPVDWLTLLDDIQQWNNPDRYVQRRWARAFWGGGSEEKEETTASPVTQAGGAEA
jgi:CRISPR system Cascade subunit CasB